MTDMPDGTLYGTITGSVSAFIGDTESDTNDLPDRVPVPTGSTISFEPSISYVIVESSPKRDIIFATPETVMLDDDGEFSVKLVACDSPNLNPTGWYYTVRLNVPGRAALTARVQVLGGQSITLGEAIGAAQPGAAIVKIEGPAGPAGHTPTVAMTGDQLVIDGVIIGPHLTGPAGPPSKLTVGTVATGAPGSQADASITGTSPSQVLNLMLPKGDPGAPGKDGVSPPAPVFTASASTLSSGSAATAAVSGTYPNLELTFGIPRGVDGAAGSGTGQTAYEMRGTGSPYGVITPPAAGVYYTDTAGTNGAWRWIATGTDRYSWQVTHGDTQWRGAPLPADVFTPSSYFQLRRQNGLLLVRCGLAILPSANVPQNARAIFPNPGNEWLPMTGQYENVYGYLACRDNGPDGQRFGRVGVWGTSWGADILDRMSDYRLFYEGSFSPRSARWPTTLPGDQYAG